MRDGLKMRREREQDHRDRRFPCSAGGDALKPLISLAVARNFAKIPCISLQIPVSGLYWLF